MNTLKAKLGKKGGFTLIEMLIVVAIIAILIAIAIPFVNGALDDARKATDDANKRAAIGMAMVEVLSKNTLGGQELTGESVSAAYKIVDGQGSLVKTSDNTAAFKYGKSKGNFEGYVTVTYTLASDTFTAAWSK